MQVENGSNVKVHYIGTLENGDEFDNSYKRGSTLDFKVGGGQMIKGFDESVIGMKSGEKKTVTLTPEMAYGERRLDAVVPVNKSNFPEDFDFFEGHSVRGNTQDGKPVMGVITEINEEDVMVDLNHPLAGKSLNFEIELVEIS
jgi:peptidylprolyl isomerase